MASANGRPGAALSEQLFDHPYRFDFFQAVRVLERWARERARKDPAQPSLPVGRDHLPDQEAVRFRAQVSLSFPAAPVYEVRPGGSEKKAAPSEMTVTFLGLIGPSGVLPHHYTRLLIQRLRARDYTLRDYLDLFHHRTLSLFYRAWEKYHVPAAFERAHLDPGEDTEDLFAWCLYCLSGLGTDHLRNPSPPSPLPFTKGARGEGRIDDGFFLYYGGHFSHFPRSASALEGILADYFELPLRVHQLQGQWLSLAEHDRLRLPSSASPRGRYNQLGVDAVIGDRVWDVQSKFRVRLGPLTLEQFRRFMPDGDGLRPLAEITRSFVGSDLDFDVQLVLRGAETPECQLASGEGEGGSRLGWNTWVHSRPLEHDVADAVFSLEV